MATAQHGAQNSQPGHTALTPFFALHLLPFAFAGTYHPLDIQSNEFLASMHFNQKTKSSILLVVSRLLYTHTAD